MTILGFSITVIGIIALYYVRFFQKKNRKIGTTLTSLIIILGSLMTLGTTVSTKNQTAPATKTVIDTSKQKMASSIIATNELSASSIATNNSTSGAHAQNLTAAQPTPVPEIPAQLDLSQLDYGSEEEVAVNNNDPAFTTDELSTVNGPFATYNNLDSLNRVTGAYALLNQSLMPSAKREALHVNPTGWHNKKISSGWLYNRSHLIGYQLTGENNNPKNLMTGTRSLNSPYMLVHEDDIAYYLKQSPDHFVRYSVTPVFRGNELLPRGVQLRAQSIGSDEIKFNVYIFNIQKGVTLNYSDGSSIIN